MHTFSTSQSLTSHVGQYSVEENNMLISLPHSKSTNHLPTYRHHSEEIQHSPRVVIVNIKYISTLTWPSIPSIAKYQYISICDYSHLNLMANDDHYMFLPAITTFNPKKFTVYVIIKICQSYSIFQKHHTHISVTLMWHNCIKI